MKKIFIAAALLALSLPVRAQKEIVKTGLNFGPLPAVGYSSDLGWHYGALTDIFWYGDGSKYPEYIWKANVEASWYSKGNSVYHAFFDSKYLIPGIRVSADLTYLGNKTTNFYGFNGAASVFNPDLNKITEDGLGFYLMRRDNFRIELTAQGTFGESNWGWVAGTAYNSYRLGHAENKGLKPENDRSLYDIYVDNGVIPEIEKNGGRHLEFKAGVVYDTRDHENNPSRGSNLEAFVYGSPDILNGRSGTDPRNHYLKFAVHYKQFFTLVQDRLVFGGHLACQGLIAGSAPFYTLQTIQPINRKNIITDGLGSTNTIRGTVANRLQGNGYAWGNFELRWSFARFRLFNQNFILATNPFFDLGMVIQPYNLEALKKLDKTIYSGNAEKLHMGAGAGLHIIMNQNFNINFELGKCLDSNDGTGLGINVGLNYIF